MEISLQTKPMIGRGKEPIMQEVSEISSNKFDEQSASSSSPQKDKQKKKKQLLLKSKSPCEDVLVDRSGGRVLLCWEAFRPV